MKIGFYNFYQDYNNNKMFETEESPIGDSLSYFTVYLYQFLTERGHEVSTLDKGDINSFDKVVFFDMPKKTDKYYHAVKKNKKIDLYLFLFESFLIRPRNYQKKNHKVFKKVFTWKDDLIDGEKYFRFYLPVKFSTDFDCISKRKLCTLIASNKLSINHKNELYTERIKAIRWFEKYASNNEFDLYGHGWDTGELNKIVKSVFSYNRLLKYIYEKLIGTKLSKLIFFFNKKIPSYAGKAKTKAEVLSKYKFSICYENLNNMNSYITEKIFDSLSNGCVPIYLGASNINYYIPADIFINKNDFSSYKDLYTFVTKISDKEFREYQSRIKKYLNSEDIRVFSADNFANIIVNEII